MIVENVVEGVGVARCRHRLTTAIAWNENNYAVTNSRLSATGVYSRNSSQSRAVSISNGRSSSSSSVGSMLGEVFN
ncbi:hypothetical protein [Nostoc sp.]|uniref:hypothetical protein n=1 Tax=Nostoc sp. TaxID=1180 RepID=UPI002FF823A7